MLVLDGLDPAPAGKTYEMWIIEGETPVPAGTFSGVDERDVVPVEGSVEAGNRVAVTHRGRAGRRADDDSDRRLRSRVTPLHFTSCEFGERRGRRPGGAEFASAVLLRCSARSSSSPGSRSPSGWSGRSQARSRRSILQSSARTSTPWSTPRTARGCSPFCEERRAGSSSPPRTSPRSCGRPSSRSRISASSSTTASTFTASGGHCGPTSGIRRSSRAARPSPSSSSRTPTSGTRGRSRGRCGRPRSPGSSSSAGARTASSPPT